MRKWYTEIDRKFSWSFFGFLLGILGVAFGLYSILHHEKPKLQFEMVTNTDVINVTENIGKLQILFDNESVISNDTTLKLITIRLANVGNISLKKDDFDKDYLVGLRFKNYQIADKPTIIDQSNKYLQDRLSFSFDSTSIKIDPILIDKNDFVTFKLLLLGPRNEDVIISPVGKIAGQSTIPILSELKTNKQSFWGYLKEMAVVFIKLLLAIIALGILKVIFEWLKVELRLRKMRKYKIAYKIETDKHYSSIFQLYALRGKNILQQILNLSDDSEKLEKLLMTESYIKGLTYQDLKHIGFQFDSKIDLSNTFNPKFFLREFNMDNNIVEERDKRKFNEEFIKKVRKFMDFLS